jgi:hypothetical protein
MKITLTAIGLLVVPSYAVPALARAILLGEDRWNPQHISGLPAEVRGALVRMCGGSIRAEHSFASYFQGTILLHFEHLRCGERGVLCTRSGYLHQVYGTTGRRYRLLRTYYGPESD